MVHHYIKTRFKILILFGFLGMMIFPLESRAGENVSSVGKNETEIMKTYLKSASDRQYTSASDRKRFSLLALELAVKSGNRDAEFQARMSLGLAFDALGENQNAMDVFEKLLEDLSEEKQTEYYVRSLNYMGKSYRLQGDFIRALEFHYKALEVSNKRSIIEEKAFAVLGLGVAFRNLGDTIQARQLYQEALFMARNHQLHRIEIMALLNLGNLFWFASEPHRAHAFYHEALQLSEKFNEKEELPALYNNIGNSFRDQKDYSKALNNYEKALELLLIHPDRALKGVILKNIGLTFFELKDLAKAESYLKQSLIYNQQNDLKRFVRDNHEQLSWVYSAKEDYKSAYLHMKEYAELNAGILNENVYQNYKSVQGKYLEQKHVYDIQREKLMKRNIWITIISASSLIFLILLLSLLRQNHQKKYYIRQLKQSISDKENTEKALRKSEKNYFTLISHMNEGMVHTDANDQILFANEKACKMFGYSLEEFIGKSVVELLELPEDKILLDEKSELRKKGVSDRYEIRFKRRNGKMLWANLSVAPVLDENGLLNGTVGIINDISEQKKHEEELKELTSDLNQKIKQLNCLYDISDITGIPGITFPEIFNKALDILPIGLKYTHDACVEIVFENQRFASKNFQETKWQYTAPIKVMNKKLGMIKVCYLTEKPIVSKDVFHFNEKILVKNIAEKLGQIIESKNMEFALKENREKLAEAHRIARLGNWEYDFEMEKFNYYENFFEIIGVNQRDRLIFDQDALFRHIHPDDAERFYNLIEDIKKCQVKDTSFQFRVFDFKGKLKHINTIGSIEYDVMGKPRRYVSTIQDITEYKLNEELRKNMEVAQKTAEIKQQFLANMSHEMRTPMNGILGMIDFLLKSSLDEKQMDYALTIKHSSENLLNIINDILDLSKIEAGKLEIKPKNFSIIKFSEKIKGLFSALAKQKNLSFLVEIQEDIPEFIIADENRVAQVATNLIGNAIKFTEKGSVKFGISCFGQSDSDVNIRIDVIDTGTGISKEDQEKLFQPFTQLDNTNTRTQEGTGLGLAISKKMVELLDGEIGFNPKYKKGSNFYFTFKAGLGHKDAVNNDTASSIPSNVNFGINALLVEDNVVNQKIFNMMLEEMGCKVTIADNGQKALEIMKSKKFHVIFMDIQMPVLDGISTMHQLRKTYKKLPPIIALSANAMTNDIERYLKEGMDDYLTKPVNPSLLYEKLAAIKAPRLAKNQKETVFMEETVKPSSFEIPGTTNGHSKEFAHFPQMNPNNIETLKRQTQNAPGLFNELFVSFIEDCEDLLNEISGAIVGKNYKALSEAIHTLKGLSGTIGATRLFEISSHIDKANKMEDYSVAVNMFPLLSGHFNELKDYISKEVL